MSEDIVGWLGTKSRYTKKLIDKTLLLMGFSLGGLF